MHIIQSPQNSQIKQLAKLLAASKHRRQAGLAVLEGVHLLSAYLDAGQMPQQVFIPQSRENDDEIIALRKKLPENIITLVSPNILKKISSLENADEIMTLVALPAPTHLPTHGDCVVLDNVQDAGNVGTVLRSAAATGIHTIILGKGCADAYSPKVLRAGMGAHFLLTICERVDLLTWRQHYHDKVLATALSEHNPVSLYDLDLRGANAWILGNEGAGVSPSLIAVADATVKIPMLGATESLNIAQAATICVFEQMRQRL